MVGDTARTLSVRKAELRGGSRSRDRCADGVVVPDAAHTHSRSDPDRTLPCSVRGLDQRDGPHRTPTGRIRHLRVTGSVLLSGEHRAEPVLILGEDARGEQSTQTRTHALVPVNLDPHVHLRSDFATLPVPVSRVRHGKKNALQGIATVAR